MKLNEWDSLFPVVAEGDRDPPNARKHAEELWLQLDHLGYVEISAYDMSCVNSFVLLLEGLLPFPVLRSSYDVQFATLWIICAK